MIAPGAGCELFSTEVFIGSLEMAAESPLDPGWGAWPSGRLRVSAYRCCQSKGGRDSSTVCLIIQAFKLTPSRESPFPPTGPESTLPSFAQQKPALQSHMLVILRKNSLFSLGEFIESAVGCQQQRMRRDHELDVVKSIHSYRIVFLRSRSKYYFIWSSHFL